MAETIPHWLTKQAHLDPDQTAIEYENGGSITFSELERKSRAFASKLASLGIKKGSHVALLSGNSEKMIISLHAISYLGAVAVMLNTRLTEAELTHQITDAEVSIILTGEDERFKAMSFPVESYAMQEVERFAEMEVKLAEEINLDEPFTIIYTSGTTGFPKGVIHTYGNHWWSAVSSALNLGLNQEDKWLMAMPIFHVSGLSILMKSVIYGMPIFMMEKFDPERAHHAIMEKGITIISVVTVMVQRLLRQLGEEKYPKAFRCMLLGGGPAPKPLLEEAEKLGIPVFQSYGMTETSSQIVTLSPKDALTKIGSAGKPLMPAQLKICGKDDEGIGEIHVKGPMVTRGYYKNSQASERAFSDGWLATGDLGRLDKDGFLYVVDRRKDLIISGGENIYPSEIESVLSGMEQIKEVGVTGVEDQTWGQVPAAFIVKSREVSEGEICAYARKFLAGYKIPKYFYFIKELPRNASNKIVRSALTDQMDE
ncbi:o-succinylbenzoate--CoA ligase [Virgibacillus sediminis]|uniref:2-succinylbenzoate--CoA ligase n=1 Tax=Virgibacillus sediminis TaxID=202260 RepID=A0ABV7A2G3_9BACI